MTSSEIWAIAGGNGAGKITFFNLFLAPQGIAFINADIIAKDIAPENPEAASYVAAELASHKREQAILMRQGFCFESVFSHPSKIDLLAQARAAGYDINLIVIYLSHAGINRARVKQRVSAGGHDVPEEKIESRIPKSHKNIAIAADLSDCVYVFDNSSYDNPFQRTAFRENGNLTLYTDKVPEWLNQLFAT